MKLTDAYKLRNEIKKSDGYADSEYGKGICAGIRRALQKLDEAEIFDLDKHDSEIRADERAKVIEEISKEVAFEERWLSDAIREDKGNYEYNIDIAFSSIKNSLQNLKEQK